MPALSTPGDVDGVPAEDTAAGEETGAVTDGSGAPATDDDPGDDSVDDDLVDDGAVPEGAVPEGAVPEGAVAVSGEPGAGSSAGSSSVLAGARPSCVQPSPVAGTSSRPPSDGDVCAAVPVA